MSAPQHPGTKTPGGCSRCDAYMTNHVEYGFHFIRVHHGEGCPGPGAVVGPPPDPDSSKRSRVRLSKTERNARRKAPTMTSTKPPPAPPTEPPTAVDMSLCCWKGCPAKRVDDFHCRTHFIATTLMVRNGASAEYAVELATGGTHTEYRETPAGVAKLTWSFAAQENYDPDAAEVTYEPYPDAVYQPETGEKLR